jgi:hypothetical protein
VLLQRLLVLPAVRHDKCPDFINAEPIRHTERRRRRAARSTWQASERTWAATGLHNEGHGRPWPGHPRLACRHKAGHDSVGGLHSSWAAWPAMMTQSWVPACAETNREAARPSPSPGPGRCLAVARLRP